MWVSPTLFAPLQEGVKECGGHSLSPYKKGAKSVGDTQLGFTITQIRF